MKKDFDRAVEQVMDQLGRHYDATERWKDEIIQHFDLAVETIRHDLAGANKDRLENHEQRLTRLEQHSGLMA